MRLTKAITMLVILAIPILALGEVIYLKDGTSIRGKITDVRSDTLYVDTEYGRVRIPKSKVLRIDYSEAGDQPAPPRPDTLQHQSADPGTLSVSFDRISFTSRIVVDWRADRAEYEVANAIEQRVIIDGVVRHTVRDTVTDKIVYRGTEVVLRNDMQPAAFKIGLPPGSYKCRVQFLTVRGTDDKYEYQDEPVDETLGLGVVDIEPTKITDFRVGYRKKKWGLAGSELFVYGALPERPQE